MRHLNYTHLLYFWTVAKEGSVTRASEVLNLTPQTISGQIKLLEDTVGESLFNRVGRGLVLTETGQVVRQYADEIFTLGAELTQRIKSKQALTPTSFNVGIVDSIPKLVALRVLEPIFGLKEPIRVSCREGRFDTLLAELAIHRLDMVISDRVLLPGSGVKAYNHPLGESRISFFAHNSIADNYTKDFPACLDEAPMLLPVQENPMRRGIEEWFDRHEINPQIRGEFDDSALLKTFGEAGAGVFAAPTAIEAEIVRMYRANPIGRTDEITESYFAISPERRLRHEAVVSITETARAGLFPDETD